ncbi:MAG: phosphopentomutase [Fimbriimonadales bacterium]
MKRAIVIVLDGCGAGHAPDAAEFGDVFEASTLLHVWQAVGGFRAPNLSRLGFLAAGGIEPAPEGARFARLRELSKGGKDSVTGHWEMMGIVTEKPFPTYPDGFPIPLIKAFEREIETQTLGNRPASGTAIIAELGAMHVETGFPIVYTSADSVFQIACHEAVVPIERLYEMCEIARRLCVAPNDVQRVIARPFEGDAATGFKRTERRKDYPLEAPKNLCDKIGDVYGIGVVPELFAGRGFRHTARTQSNPEHLRALKEALASDAKFIFANFEDFDMLYGHRNDPAGFAKCLEEFDVMLGEILTTLGPDDLLLLTADHGNDPTSPSTDHSREFVPAVVHASGLEAANLGDVDGMTAIGATVAGWLGVPWNVGRDLCQTIRT